MKKLSDPIENAAIILAELRAIRLWDKCYQGKVAPEYGEILAAITRHRRAYELLSELFKATVRIALTFRPREKRRRPLSFVIGEAHSLNEPQPNHVVFTCPYCGRRTVDFTTKDLAELNPVICSWCGREFSIENDEKQE